MTDLATRIADVKKKAIAWRDIAVTSPDYWAAWSSFQDIEPELFIEMADEIDRLKAQLEKAREELAKSAKLRFLADCYADTPDEYTQHDLLQEALLRARVHAELAQKEKE